MLIHNAEVGEIVREQARLNIAEGWPQNLLPNVQPVLDITPDFHKKINLVKTLDSSGSGSATVFTTATDVDTYITGIQFSFIKDATCDAANTSDPGITVTIGGLAVQICKLAMLTLTAQSQAIYMPLTIPVKVDRGTNVAITSVSYTAGTLVRATSIHGYTVQ